MPSVKLYYFNARGLVEVTRHLLDYGNIEYEDVRLSPMQMAELKPNTPFGQVPMLEWDGVKYAQANAIARFVAKKVGLYGKDEVEGLRVDSTIELLREYAESPKLSVIASPALTTDERNAALAKYVAEELPKFLTNAEKLLKEHGGTYFVGNQLTWADIAVTEFLNDITSPTHPILAALGVHEESRLTILKKYPLLEAHLARIRAVPSVKKRFQTRPSNAADTESYKNIFATRAAAAAASAKK